MLGSASREITTDLKCGGERQIPTLEKRGWGTRTRQSVTRRPRGETKLRFLSIKRQRRPSRFAGAPLEVAAPALWAGALSCLVYDERQSRLCRGRAGRRGHRQGVAACGSAGLRRRRRRSRARAAAAADEYGGCDDRHQDEAERHRNAQGTCAA